MYTQTVCCCHLQEFSGLRTLYLECNAISAIEGLHHMNNLCSLFLSKNLLWNLSGIESLTSLQSLDISHNKIDSLGPLACLLQLRSLNAAHNKLAGEADVSPLASCRDLEMLDLAANRLVGSATFDVITSLRLLLLKLQGNPIVTETRCDAVPRASLAHALSILRILPIGAVTLQELPAPSAFCHANLAKLGRHALPSTRETSCCCLHAGW
jgi:hypothetical protein